MAILKFTVQGAKNLSRIHSTFSGCYSCFRLDILNLQKTLELELLHVRGAPKKETCMYVSLLPRPVPAIRVIRGGLGTECDNSARIFPTSLTVDDISEVAEDDWELGCMYVILS